MKRKNIEAKQKVDPCVLAVLPILIVGAILGAILGYMIELNTTSIFIRIGFCICTAGFSSIMALYLTYFVLEAIEKTQDMIKTRKEKGFID